MSLPFPAYNRYPAFSLLLLLYNTGRRKSTDSCKNFIDFMHKFAIFLLWHSTNEAKHPPVGADARKINSFSFSEWPR
jgi:hypothetical protein